MKSGSKQSRISTFSGLGTLDTISNWLAANGVEAIEITTTDGAIRIASAGDVGEHHVEAAEPVGPETAKQTIIARAPLAGVFLPGHPDRPSPEIGDADVVEIGRIVGFVQVGRILVAVRAEAAGQVDVADLKGGHLVGYGDTLMSNAEARQ